MSRIRAMLRTRGIWPAVEAELIRLDVPYSLRTGGKHPIVVINIGDARRRVPIAGSPHTRGQSKRKAVCQIRRIVGEMRGGAHG